MDRGAWWATVYMVAESDTTEAIQHAHMHISLPFGISFLFRSPQCIKQNSLCYTVGSHQLSILYKVSMVYMCQTQSPNSTHQLPPAKCFTGFKSLETSLGLILQDYTANETAPGGMSLVLPVVGGQVKFGTNRETVCVMVHTRRLSFQMNLSNVP